MKNNPSAAHDTHFDLLRILAMLIVILFHYTAQFSNKVMRADFALFISADYVRFAISLFLLMVGYFSLRSAANDTVSAGQYLKKRILRLMPTFWLCLTITSLVLICTKTETITIKRFLLNAILLNRFFGVPFVDGAYWYMLIIVIFTAFMTVAKLLGKPALRSSLYAAYGAVFLLCGAVNRFVRPFPVVVSFGFFEYVNRCLVGLLIAYLFKNQKTAVSRELFSSVLLILVLMFGEFLWCSVKDSLIDCLAVALFLPVVWFGSRLHFHQKLSAVIRSVALESFFIYLVHQRIGFLLMKWLIDRGVNCNLAVLITILFVAVLAVIHNLLHRFLKTRARQRTAA